MKWSLACAALVLAGGACAKGDAMGGGGGQTDAKPKFDGQQQDIDAPNRVIDSPVNNGPDAALAITLTETTDNTIVTASTISCNNGTSTSDNTWYRAFQLSDYSAITGGLHITQVTLGVEQSSGLPITVKIGSYSGALDGTTINSGQLTNLATANATSTATDTGALQNVPIVADIPAAGKFVVQVSSAAVSSGYFVLGSTSSAETHTAYWSSSGCSQTTPETSSASGQSTHDILTVSGTH